MVYPPLTMDGVVRSAKSCSLLLLSVGAALLPLPESDAADCEVVFALEPAGTQAEGAEAALQEQISLIGSAPGAGVLYVLSQQLAGDDSGPAKAAALAREADLTLWIGLSLPGSDAASAVSACRESGAAGVALIAPKPQGTPPETADLAGMLAVKAAGERLAQWVREFRTQLGSEHRLLLCTDIDAVSPETGAGFFLPAKDLVRDGTLDAVCLSGVEHYNFHRLRLLRDTPLRSGLLADARLMPVERGGGHVRRLAAAALGSATCDSLWVLGLAPSQAVPAVVQTFAQWRYQEEQERTLAMAIERKEIVVDQGMPDSGRSNLATVHGVAQSFAPSRDGTCPLVQIYAALRLQGQSDLAPLAVEMRNDADGKPSAEVIRRSEIRFAAFREEPSFGWGTARFDPPVPLARGTTYWLYLPNAQSESGTYVWGMAAGKAGERGRAWSRTYDYSKHSWIYRIYLASVE